MAVSSGGRKRTIQQIPAQRLRKARLERVSHGMTESHKTQDQAKQLYCAIMANTYFGMALIDVNCKILTVNSALSTYFHKPASELIGGKCYQEFEKRSSICPHCPGTQAMATGEPAAVETDGVRDDGSRFSVRIQAFPTTDPDGAVTGFIVILEDISERKVAEEAYHALVDHSLQGLAIFQDGHVVFANRAMAEVTGYSVEQMLVMPAEKVQAFVHLEDRALVWARHKQRLAGKNVPDRYQFRGIRRDGTLCWLELNARRIDYQGRPAIQAAYIDITECKKAEESLRESGDKYRTLLENLPQKIFLKDRNYVYISCNGNYARDLKINPEQIVGKTDYDFHPKVLAEKYRADDERIISSGQATEIEDKYIQDGRDVTVHTVKTPVRDDQGHIVGVLGIFWDITERKKVEDALRESEEKHRDLFENARDAIVTTDVEAKITGVNKLVEEYGFKKEQLLGKGIFDFIVEQHKERGLEDFKAAISGNPVRGEMDVITPRGIFTAEYIDNPIKRAGEIIGIQAVLRDITERRRAEQLLRKERDRAQKYLDVAGVMLVAIDSEQRVGLINKKGCEISGYTEEEILGKNWFDNFVPERVRQDVRAVFTGLMRGQSLMHQYYENPIRTKNSDERLIAWHNTILRDQKGNVIATLSSGEDITERKKAEQKLLEYQKKLQLLASQLTLAEERERRRIATGLHDQVNQSLAISKIKLDALRKSMRSGENARVLEEICSTLGQAIAETRSLTFDLGYPILHELGLEAAVASWLSEQIEAKHRILTKFEDDGQRKPLDDDVRAILFRNVRELLVNTVKHANARAVKVSIRKVNKQIELSVQDDGVGFEPAEALAKGVREGKYGLFSVKERLEQLGGRLEIESAPDRGCKVTMTVPLKQDGTLIGGKV